MDPEIITAYVGLGSNLGDRAGNLLMAVRGLLEASFDVKKLSGIYETEPVDIEDATPFLNMVAEVQARGITPTQMLARMLRIEYLLGRKDKSMKRPRTIDLDLLFYANVRVDTPFLTVPHPRIHERRFVLVPMAEIAPQFVHPGFNKNISHLLANTEDTAGVKRWNPNGSNGNPVDPNC